MAANGFGLKRLSRLALPVAAVALQALLLQGCGQNATDNLAAGPGTFTAVYNDTLKTACIQCHEASSSTGGTQLDLTTKTTAYNTIFGNASSPSNSACRTAKIVVASQPTKSYLLAVLFSDYSSTPFPNTSGCTPYATHHTDQNLSTDERASMIKWIQDGAQNN